MMGRQKKRLAGHERWGTKPSRKSLITKFRKGTTDALWSDVIKLLAKEKCEYCGKTEHLNSHHIFSRSNLAVRWDVDNGICLCVGHHIFGNFSAHKAPIDFIEWLKDKRGLSWYERLRIKARLVVHLSEQDKINITDHLKKEYEKLSRRQKKH